jgi:flagellar biosynthesis chaperone FliJ
VIIENNFIEHLKEFLLELVFYNRLLRCFVIIDLKIGKVSHQDIGQMQMFVNYYDREIKQDDENPTVVNYALPEDNKTIFSSEYKLHMPT